MSKWNELASSDDLNLTLKALEENGVDVFVVDNGKKAKDKVLELLPEQAEVMTMTSVTLEAIGVLPEINSSGRYDSVREKLGQMDRNTQNRTMQEIGAAPEWAIGSVHAITHKGEIVIASNTGSQLPAYVYGADHVIWVVGTQKIVSDLDTAFKRLYEYTLELESERARKVYGVSGSAVNKLLIINREVKPGRLKVIFVKECLGF